MYVLKEHREQNLGEGEFYHQIAQKKFGAPSKNQTQDPLSSSSSSMTVTLGETYRTANN